ncbi:MAG: hypothetical protein COB59_11365 [Rhodospirillaceae bacterium]|nr:MAG: hypothetical protein COB59_11365 [Rhodospirillaceae bacterium]
MISYTLICPKDHEFSQQFDSYDDCQAKLKTGTMKCPTCGSQKLVKGLSAPSVGGQSQTPQPMQPQCPSASTCGASGCGLKG